jgi:hypothetical protein
MNHTILLWSKKLYLCNATTDVLVTLQRHPWQHYHGTRGNAARLVRLSGNDHGNAKGCAAGLFQQGASRAKLGSQRQFIFTGGQ